LGKYDAYSVHRRVDYARYTYKNADKYSAFDDLQFPIAVYDHSGIIVGTNRYFRSIAEVSADDIRFDKINIFDLLNEQCTALIEAAHDVFNGDERVYEAVGCALGAEPGTIKYLQLEDYPNAIFFPMAYELGEVRLGAILLDRK
jgi:hypothetical protein